MLLIFILIPVRMIYDGLDGGTICIVTTHVDVSAVGLIYFAAYFVVVAALYTRRDLIDRRGIGTALAVIGAVAMIAFTRSFSYNDGVFGHRKSAAANPG